MSVPRKKCPKCGEECDRFDNCWKCIKKKMEETKKKLMESLNEEQVKLFEEYEKTESKWTSIIIRD